MIKNQSKIFHFPQNYAKYKKKLRTSIFFICFYPPLSLQISDKEREKKTSRAIP